MFAWEPTLPRLCHYPLAIGLLSFLTISLRSPSPGHRKSMRPWAFLGNLETFGATSDLKIQERNSFCLPTSCWSFINLYYIWKADNSGMVRHIFKWKETKGGSLWQPAWNEHPCLFLRTRKLFGLLRLEFLTLLLENYDLEKSRIRIQSKQQQQQQHFTSDKIHKENRKIL